MRINKKLAIDIRADFCTRMRSLNRAPKEIAQLDFFLRISLDNLNDLHNNTSVT